MGNGGLTCDFEELRELLICRRCGGVEAVTPGMILSKICPGLRRGAFKRALRNHPESKPVATPGDLPSAIPPQEADIPCIYRHGPPAAIACKPCQAGGVSPLAFVCARHGGCTLHNLATRRRDGSRWHACETCDEKNTGGLDTR